MPDTHEPTVPEPLLEQIARERMNVPTLVGRRSDRLDFHEIACWELRDALAAAYRAGFAAATKPEVRL